MENSNWFRQSSGKPLFDDLLWSRPQNRQAAGKLLIIGGSSHGFAAPAEAYQAALAAGVGAVQVIMPVAVKSVAGRLLDTIDYAPSTPSGSFSQAALSEFLDGAAWADAVLLAGDLSRNSQTAIAIEKLFTKYSGPLILAKDSADYALSTAATVVQRPDTLLVVTIAQLQKLLQKLTWPVAVTFNIDLIRLVDLLSGFTSQNAGMIMVKHLDTLILAINGRVSTTPTSADPEEFWRVKKATTAAVWWLQNPAKPFEAITTSLV